MLVSGAEIIEDIGHLDAVFPTQLLVESQRLPQDKLTLLLHSQVPGERKLKFKTGALAGVLHTHTHTHTHRKRDNHIHNVLCKHLEINLQHSICNGKSHEQCRVEYESLVHYAQRCTCMEAVQKLL